MTSLQFRRITPLYETLVRTFLKDVKGFAPGDVDHFLVRYDRWADSKGQDVSLFIGDELLQLALPGIGPGIGHSIYRTNNGTPQAYVSDRYPISSSAIKLTSNLMAISVEDFAALLKFARILFESSDAVLINEAKYDAQVACRGTGVSFVDTFAGNRIDLF